MGCDIHLHIEYKVGDGPWTADSNHQTYKEDGYTYLTQVHASRRDYQLFSKLAGVRGEGPESKGLPEDCSEIIKNSTTIEDYGDDHSHSWSSFEDFKTALCESDYDLNKKAEPSAFGPGYGHDYENLVAYINKQLDGFKAELETEQMLLDQPINTTVECRLVYWFDN